MAFDHELALTQIPHTPGVYLMKDKRERVIYVGKAKDLHRRIRQYFTGKDSRAFVSMLADVLGRIDVIITASEREALILEAGLIKRHRPRFNVILKDDKDMPRLRIDPGAAWPRVEIVRRSKSDGAHYYGPYVSGQACRKSLEVINRHFKLRTCRDTVFANRSRPCLQYEIHRCMGPCVYDVSRDEYMRHCRDAELFLSGKFDDLRSALRARMMLCSEALAFEQAASYRDQLMAVEEVCARQQIVQKVPVNQDYWACFGHSGMRAIVAMMVREGRLMHMETYEARDEVSSEDDILSQVMVHHYQSFENFPAEVILDGAYGALGSLLNETLSALSGRRIVVTFPRRGIKAGILATAQANAEQQFHQAKSGESDLLMQVQAALGLSRYPHRIECYDISNMQGGQIVAAMVVFVQGRLDASKCRTFRVKTVTGQDDFGSLNEVLTRRLRYLGGSDETQDEESASVQGFREMPDLLLIDGGRGQVDAVMAAVRAAGLEGAFDVVGIGKSRVKHNDTQEQEEVLHSPERLYFPGRVIPLVLDQSSDEILLLARIRDETHRRAIGLHRRARQSEGLRSRLDSVDGVGPKRKVKLLRAFGSIQGIVQAAPEDVAKAAGISTVQARRIIEALGGDS
ncbi:MAG: excinuclease ABC subunit UvrC [Proteobacteria bacterium]|nr:excinuclease ABC subunit UvrC [Pseudomonadota bacterium]